MGKIILPIIQGGSKGGFGQLQFDNKEELEACLFLSKHSVYPIAHVHAMFYLIKKHNPGLGWEDLLKKTAEILVEGSSNARDPLDPICFPMYMDYWQPINDDIDKKLLPPNT